MALSPQFFDFLVNGKTHSGSIAIKVIGVPYHLQSFSVFVIQVDACSFLFHASIIHHYDVYIKQYPVPSRPTRTRQVSPWLKPGGLRSKG